MTALLAAGTLPTILTPTAACIVLAGHRRRHAPGSQRNTVMSIAKFYAALGNIQTIVRNCRYGLAALLLLCSTSLFAQFDNSSLQGFGEDSFLPVEEAYQLQLDFTQQGQLHFNWQIAEGYYLYQHAFKFILNPGQQEQSLTPDLSQGLAKTDEYFGDVVVYYHYADAELNQVPVETPYLISVRSQGCADAGLCYPPRTQFFELDPSQRLISEVAAPAPASNTTPSANIANQSISGSSDDSPTSWAAMLLLALLGGMILNLMPCVFPVLSLKALSFSQSEGNHLSQGFAYSAGVIVSFIAVAALMLSLQTAGQAIGWGFQLQSPWFVGALVYLFFIMGLALSGYIEIGARWSGAGQGLTQRQGLSGSFFTGVLATVVASPCTAPFMGAALGFAVTQPAAIALSVFATLGLGMALPLLILSASPALLRFFPKPGAWMEQFKQLLAFPLYATALWLCWVIGNQAGSSAMAAIIGGCLLLAFALWCWRQHWFGRLSATVLAVLALSLLQNPLLNSSHAEASAQNWEPYSQQRLQALRQQGKPVFLNITADWCITCLANEKVTLNTAAVRETLQQQGVVYMKGDWTNRDERITALLAEYGRNGIPLYLAFPADAAQPAIMLPQILNKKLVIDTLKTL